MSKKNKSKFITAIGIFLLLGLVSCGAKQEDTSQVSVHPTIKEEQKQDQLSALPDKIQDILYKDGEFYDVERKQTYTKSSYQIDLWEHGNEERKTVYWEEYLVLDIDQDGQKELLVRVKNKDFSEPSTRIFDVEQDTVYCYSYVFRAILHVYPDGVILGSSGAAYNTFYSLKFKNGKAEETIVAETKGTGSGFFIGEEKVSEKEYCIAVEKYDDENDEKWIAFEEHNEEQQENTSDSSPEPTIKEEQKQDQLSALPDEIQDILYKDGEFYDVERKQTYTKSSYQIDLWDYGNEERKTVYWEEYLVLDLDQDGQKELLVRVKNKDFSELSTRIFDVEQDTVYCYSYVFRATIEVYADGAIRGSSGASDWKMYSLKFKNGKAEETIIAEMESRIDAASKCNCFIGTQKVSSDELFAFMEKYNSQDGEKWIAFEEHNEEQQENTSESSPEPTIKEEPKQDNLSALPVEIQDILYKDGEFYDVERKQTYTKSSYQVVVWNYEGNYENNRKAAVYWKKYLVLDLDGDGQKELLVQISNDHDSVEATRIFDVQQDKVYCYSYSLYETKQIYTDGIIYKSGWNEDGKPINNTFFSLKFKGEKTVETVVAESKRKTGGFDYFVEKKKVSPDEFYKYTEKYNSQDEEKWITFDK